MAGACSARHGQPVGRCCRVWLPDVVLPAGDRLRAALEGANSANFSHLRRKHPTTKFSVFGTATLALPPWKRLQVVALCADQQTLEKVEVDVLDLVETACDVVADALGLSDEQVQQAYEDIRVERHDMKLPLVTSAPQVEGLVSPAPQADGLVSLSGLQAKTPPPTAGVVRPFSAPSAFTNNHCSLPSGGDPPAPVLPKAPAMEVVEEPPVFLPEPTSELRMPPPSSTTGHKRKRKGEEEEPGLPAPLPKSSPALPRQVEPSATSQAEPPAEAPRGKRTAPRLNSKPPAAAPPPLHNETRSTSSASSSSSEEEASAEEGPSGEEELGESTAPVGPLRVQLFKLGQLCCSVVARFAGGNQKPELLQPSLQIDQRATLERCRDHLEWAGDLTTVWRLCLAARGGHASYNALCDYFVAKQRVGLVETPTYAVYIVPPDEKYLKEMGLADSRHIVGLQIPTVTGPADA